MNDAKLMTMNDANFAARPRFPLNHSTLSSRIPVREEWRDGSGEGSATMGWKNE